MISRNPYGHILARAIHSKMDIFQYFQNVEMLHLLSLHLVILLQDKINKLQNEEIIVFVLHAHSPPHLIISRVYIK